MPETPPPEVRMSCQYGVETIRTNDGLVLITYGELDAANAGDWYAAMAEVVENHCGTTSISSVIVDLCRVGFLSCAGVRAVLRLAERGARGDVAVRITVPDDGPVPRIVDVLAVRQNLPVVACRVSGPHAAEPPRECRSPGAVRPNDALGRTMGGPGNNAQHPRTRIIDRTAPVAGLSRGDVEPR
ncbi:STAS domain-containing protein [Nocardia abscessus]|uniref:STAS domain-containing protein n=1 Tax=Nocardia abscessus TaxID=120957 RepID=A0ABS0C598_9NOCA|nr:STAS domain-containing protein [Nocardia abscessus]MBF6225559.1 STAS domain-containing protein [Nocardia abscessus]